MKKSLMLLAALAGLSQAADTWTWTTKDEGKNTDACGGVVFTLSPTNARMSLTTESENELPDTVVLQSISFQLRNSLVSSCIYVTDENSTILAFSEISAAGAASEWVTFNFAPIASVVGASETKSNVNQLNLNVGSTYYAYVLNAGNDIAHTDKAYVGSTLTGPYANSFNPKVSNPSPQFTAATWAQCGEVADNSLQNPLYQLYAPMMRITVTPEPATATLSLLALAGLATRRRRH